MLLALVEVFKKVNRSQSHVYPVLNGGNWSNTILKSHPNKSVVKILLFKKTRTSSEWKDKLLETITEHDFRKVLWKAGLILLPKETDFDSGSAFAKKY